MKKGLKIFLIVIAILFILIGLTLAAALPGLKEVTDLDIESVDLTQIPDGSYTGSYDSFRWSTSVKVTIMDHRITDIQSVKIQDGRDSLTEDLKEKVLSEQTADVDAVSGATASSNAYLKAIENALKNGSDVG
ncbi:MAG: FMN-binding protein [Oscillospiraceae bacterium]|nr:FMN-binding protein [Oscillospiraceae bacterium]